MEETGGRPVLVEMVRLRCVDRQLSIGTILRRLYLGIIFHSPITAATSRSASRATPQRYTMTLASIVLERGLVVSIGSFGKRWISFGATETDIAADADALSVARKAVGS